MAHTATLMRGWGVWVEWVLMERPTHDCVRCLLCGCGAVFNMTSSRFDWDGCKVTADNCITDGSGDDAYAINGDCTFEVLRTGVLTSMEHGLSPHPGDTLTINGEQVLDPRGVLPVEGNGATIEWRSNWQNNGAGWTICWSPGASEPPPCNECLSLLRMPPPAARTTQCLR